MPPSRGRPAEDAAGAVGERTWRRALAGGALLLLALFAALPDKVFVFDGVMFAGVIERSITEWRAELLNRRHLLFNPALMGLRDLLARLGAAVPGYALIQRVNAVLGAAGALLFAALLRSLRLPRWTAAAGAALLAATFAYGARATEGQVYMTLALAQLWTLFAALALVERPGLKSALRLAFAFAAGCAFHAANVVMAVPCAVALALAARRAGPKVLLAAPAAALLTVLPFALAFKLSTWTGVLTFLGRATELQMSGSPDASGLLERALRYNAMSPLDRASAVLQQLWESFAAGSLPAKAHAALGAALLAGLAWPAARALRDARRRAPALVLASGALAGIAFAAYWQGGEFFWVAPAACLIALALLGAPEEPRLPAFTAAVAASLLAWNVFAGLLPRSRVENNEGYRRALFVRDHTPPSCWIVISGLGFPNQKVYLGYFAHRSRNVLEYYLDRLPKAEALRRFSAFARANEEAGVPMYLLPDLVDDARALEALRARWGVTVADLKAAFGPGRLVATAAQDPGFRVFLFVPKDEPEPLFAVLSYNVLTESDPQRLAETAASLKDIAAGMAPAQRASAARLLARSGYGSELLMSAFAGYMNPEGLAAARTRLERFAEYRKTADFHLRLGNLYGYLGRTDLLRREWTAAYQLSGDKNLRERLERLR